ncbi:phosphopantetheine-binding protein [Crossiella sp. SN42]|uniref:phosphopantetheine-binding protein n=1 Tax=Crossiella sp. SN42 TaxID=2944808 RepID=UPI00207D2CB9|nr:phosphopantetheine-binding protein [Crossiella sp. SN42]MCO1578415.1 phosphopantetheine-binding protein [Crossiella sp. SN42]
MTSNLKVDVPELIAAIYRETLGDATLDTGSDFFEAGGDSLAAFQITARIQESLGAEVPVALVFAYPSPADLASVVDLEPAQG